MKLNKTLMMAALIAGSVFAADVAVRAQDATTNTPPAGARPPGARGPRMNFETISTQLGLSDEQKTKAKPVFEDMQKKMAEVRNDTSLEAADKRTKNKEIRDAANVKLKEIFTPEQFEKWQKMTPGNRRSQGGAGGGNKPPQ